MRKVSMATRKELIEAVGARYRACDRSSKGKVLDEFVAVTWFHRKHAMRVLRQEASDRTPGRVGRRVYDEAVRTALVVLWEASDRLCGKRLKPLIPILVEAMEGHGHLDLAPQVKASLFRMSPATIDRSLRAIREAGQTKKRRGGVSGTELRRSVPIRTFDGWGDPAPGHMEVDLVSHSGPAAKGSWAWTFTLTDIATGWTECAPLLVREQTLLVAVLTELRRLMPFPLLGFDSDNDSVFINETVRDYCVAHGIAFTRCRPYRKNDQAWVEQKNGSVVRRLTGYRRFEGLEATGALAELYTAARLFVNFFQPSSSLPRSNVMAPRSTSDTRSRDAVPAVAGRPTDLRGDAPKPPGGVRRSRSGPAVAGHSDGARKVGRTGRRGSHNERIGILAANAGCVHDEPADLVARRRGKADSNRKGPAEALAPPS